MGRGPEIREPTYLVLTALAGGRLHGYGVIQEVEAISAGKVRLRAGTLYATLDRLVDEGLVNLAGEEVVEGRLRRYYRLTPQGRATLAQVAKERMATAKETLRRLRLVGGLA